FIDSMGTAWLSNHYARIREVIQAQTSFIVKVSHKCHTTVHAGSTGYDNPNRDNMSRMNTKSGFFRESEDLTAILIFTLAWNQTYGIGDYYPLKASPVT
ncbi:hypothetical protein MPER_03646, partial [Moniliophthora perniciosa FA553]